MAVARQYQQPRSIILGRALPAHGEPLWLPEDLEWAIAYEGHLDGICKNCGTARDIWEGAKPGEAPFVGVPKRCGGCEEIALTEKEIPESEQGMGLRVELIPGEMYDWQQDVQEAADRLNLPDPTKPRPRDREPVG